MKRSRKRRKKRGRGGTPKTKRKTFDIQQHNQSMAGLKKEIDQLAAAQAQQQAAEYVMVQRPSKAARMLGIQNTNLARARIESAKDPNAMAREFGIQATANIFREFLSKKPTLTFDHAILMFENATADTVGSGDKVYKTVEEFAKSKSRLAKGYRNMLREPWKRAKKSMRGGRRKRRRTRRGRGYGQQHVAQGAYGSDHDDGFSLVPVYTPPSEYADLLANRNADRRPRANPARGRRGKLEKRSKVGKFFGLTQRAARVATRASGQRARTKKLLGRGKNRRRQRRTRRHR